MENKGPYYDQIDAYLSGQLEPGEQEAMLKAIGQDAALAREIEMRRLEFDVSEALIADVIRQQLQRLQSEPSPPVRPPKIQKIYLIWLIAAILVVAAIGIYRWNRPASQPQAMPPPASTDQPKDIVPSLPSAPQAVQTPNENPQTPRPTNEQNRRYLALATELYQNPDFETLRGAAPDAADPLETALTAWQKQDYTAAVSALRYIKSNDPKYWRAVTLRAHAQFKLGQFGPAARSFAAVADSKMMPWCEDADGYLLLALLADGQAGTAAFRARLDKVLSDTGHPWFEQAKTLQSRLKSK
jgi:hypothetical protein